MNVTALSRMVKFEHSLFALPFAAAAAVLVSSQARLDPLRLLLVALAVVSARTAAMAMNRIADRAFDTENPRTKGRELVTGAVSARAAWLLLVGSAAAFVALAWAVRPLCGALALPVLAILLGYSYGKRFTWAVHLWLGLAQALGPIGVAIALTGEAPAAALVLGLGVGAWVAGFDVLYALQDEEFDRHTRLHSIPARFGAQGALLWSRLLHVFAAVAIAAAGLLAHRGAGWFAGSVLMTALLAAEHVYAAPGGDLRRDRIGAAFFQFNAFASVGFAVCAIGDLALRSAP